MSNPPRNAKAENTYLRKALALRRKLQQFLDENAAGDVADDQGFTLGDGCFRPVTRAQRGILMEMAPEDVRKANE